MFSFQKSDCFNAKDFKTKKDALLFYILNTAVKEKDLKLFYCRTCVYIYGVNYTDLVFKRLKICDFQKYYTI